MVEEPRIPRTTLKAVGLMAVSVLVYLACLEMGVRFLIDDGMQYDLEMWKYARELKRVSAHPAIGHEHRPNVRARLMGVDVEINARGQRDRDFARPKPERTVRVLMLGDSLTFGWGVANEHTVAKQLEALLDGESEGLHFEVVNAGVGNYNAAMSSHWMRERGLAYEPDLVVFNYSFNDAEVTPRRGGGGLAEWSYAYIYFSGRLGEVARRMSDDRDWLAYYRGLYHDEAKGWRDAQEQIRELARFCEQHALPLVLVNYPELHQLDPYPLAEISHKVRELARSLALPHLDLIDSLRGEEPESLWVTPGDPHPNARAHALIADAIFRFLTDGDQPMAWVQAGSR